MAMTNPSLIDHFPHEHLYFEGFPSSPCLMTQGTGTHWFRSRSGAFLKGPAPVKFASATFVGAGPESADGRGGCPLVKGSLMPRICNVRSMYKAYVKEFIPLSKYAKFKISKWCFHCCCILPQFSDTLLCILRVITVMGMTPNLLHPVA